MDDEKVATEVETVTDAPPLPEKKKRTRKPATTKKSPPKKVKAKAKKVKAKSKTNSKAAKGAQRGPRGPRKDSIRSRLRNFLMGHKGKQVTLAAVDKAVEGGSKSLNNLAVVMKAKKEKFELRREKNQKGERTVGMYPVKR